MLHALQEITGIPKSSARVVDGTLILSLLDAVSPVVWRWNLGEAKASALEVRETKDGEYKLILKTPRGDVQDVAPFENRAKAMSALMAVSKAMQNAQGYNYSNAQDATKDQVTPIITNPQPKSGGIKIITVLGAIALVFILLTWLGSIIPTRMDTNVRTGVATQTTDPTESAGVPVSADDFLSGF
ncbi:MAG: hypothetical protein AAF569_02275 [Pseudomonadota bacterium]